MFTQVTSGICAADVKQAPQDDKMQRMMDLLKSYDVPIGFYAKVIDQLGNPVVSARVVIRIRRSTGTKELTIHTDEAGFFELVGEKGHLVYVGEIEKKGYEFDIQKNRRGFTYSATTAEDLFVPDQTNPVIFYMRKKEPPTLVIPGNLHFDIGPVGRTYGIDLVKRKVVDPEPSSFGRYDKEEQVDLVVRGELSPDGSMYLLHLSTPDQASGVIVSDELLYRAPEVGYEPERVLEIPASGGLRKYFYVKGRAGGIYSRIDANVRTREKGMRVDLATWTNPNGELNVDHDEELWEKEIDRRYEERTGRKIGERPKYLEKQAESSAEVKSEGLPQGPDSSGDRHASETLPERGVESTTKREISATGSARQEETQRSSDMSASKETQGKEVRPSREEEGKGTGPLIYMLGLLVAVLLMALVVLRKRK